MRRALAAVAVLGLVPCSPAAAQDPTLALHRGDRIRLRHSCAPGDSTGALCQSVGRLVASGDGTITLEAGESTLTHRVGGVSRIEVSRGERSYWRAGAAVGLVTGAAGTYVLLNRGGSTSPCDEGANQDAIGPSGCAGLIALGGVAGAGLGALVGGLVKTERWQEVRVDALRLSLTSRPRRGLHAIVALSF